MHTHVLALGLSNFLYPTHTVLLLNLKYHSPELSYKSSQNLGGSEAENLTWPKLVGMTFTEYTFMQTRQGGQQREDHRLVRISMI